MRIITNPQLLNSMREVRPVRISVAYIGIDWRNYIDDENLDEIIVSPTLGSNPRAIRQLVELLGWDRVHFLDALHAKFYIGETMATLGSFNLSSNGIGAQGLEELGVVTEDAATIQTLNSEFQRLKRAAAILYPTPQCKEARLTRLQTQRNRAIAEGILNDENPPTPISIYTPTTASDLHVMWFRNVDVEKNYERLSAGDPQLNETTFDSVVEDWTNVQEMDDIAPGSWILLWRARLDGMPHLTSNPRWLYVHQVISEAVLDAPYTKMIIQRNDKDKPIEPFDIESNHFAGALRTVLATNDFSAFRKNGDEPWSVQTCGHDTRRLIDALKHACKIDG